MHCNKSILLIASVPALPFSLIQVIGAASGIDEVSQRLRQGWGGNPTSGTISKEAVTECRQVSETMRKENIRLRNALQSKRIPPVLYFKT